MSIFLVVNKLLDGIKVKLHCLFIVEKLTQVFALHVERSNLFSFGLQFRFEFFLQVRKFLREASPFFIEVCHGFSLLDNPFFLRCLVSLADFRLPFALKFIFVVLFLDIFILYDLLVMQFSRVSYKTTIDVLHTFNEHIELDVLSVDQLLGHFQTNLKRQVSDDVCTYFIG